MKTKLKFKQLIKPQNDKITTIIILLPGKVSIS